MGFIIFLIFLALVFSLILSKVKYGKAAEWAKIVRIVIVISCISIFGYWFVERSTVKAVKDSISLQVINKLPQPLDFYVVGINRVEDVTNLETKHVGKIRPEHYRIEYLKISHSDEYWIVGYLGKKNLVYFSQHYVPNKNMDQVVEVNNYFNQSEKLSSTAKRQVEAYNFENIFMATWVTLNLLLLFINIVLLFKKKKVSSSH